jgi:hypothetical protein
LFVGEAPGGTPSAASIKSVVIDIAHSLPFSILRGHGAAHADDSTARSAMELAHAKV